MKALQIINNNSVFKVDESVKQIPYIAFDDIDKYQIKTLQSNESAKLAIKNLDGCVAQLDIKKTGVYNDLGNDGSEVSGTIFYLDTGDVSNKLPAGMYSTELWIYSDTDERIAIYPDDGFCPLVISENATMIAGNYLPVTTIDDIKNQIINQLKDLDDETLNQELLSKIKVGNVTSLASDAQPTVKVTNNQGNLLLNFGIPQGKQGLAGSNGTDGKNATITIGEVKPLAPGSQPTVTNSGTDNSVLLNFGIPVAKNGIDGKSSYLHLAYASDNQGTDFTFTPNNKSSYLGIYTDNQAENSLIYSRYQWLLIKGTDTVTTINHELDSNLLQVLIDNLKQNYIPDDYQNLALYGSHLEGINEYNNKILPLYNYNYTGKEIEYYPYNSILATGSSIGTPIPLSDNLSNQGIVITGKINSSSTGGSLEPIINGASYQLLNSPVTIKNGTEFSFLVKVNGSTTSQPPTLNFVLHKYTGTLGIQSLTVSVNNQLINYQMSYQQVLQNLNQLKLGTSVTVSNLNQLYQVINQYLQARYLYYHAVIEQLYQQTNLNHQLIVHNQNNLDNLATQLIQVNPNKIKGGNVSPFDNMSSNEMRLEGQDLDLNTITISLPVRATSGTDSNCTTQDKDWETIKNNISLLQSLGYQVIIQPYPFIANGTVIETDWQPNDKETFFKTYGAILTQLAQLAESNKVYGLYVATNLEHLEQYDDDWVTLIQHIKTFYHGKVFFRTNWWYTASWDSASLANYQTRLNHKFWNDVDVIAIAAYFEVTDQSNPTSEELQQDLYSTPINNRQQNIVQEIQNFNTKWNKPIFFGELGIPPYSNACAEPYNRTLSNGAFYDESVQANWFNAWYEVFKVFDWWLGYSIFTIVDRETPYNPIGKMAQSTIKLESFNLNNQTNKQIADLKQQINDLQNQLNLLKNNK